MPTSLPHVSAILLALAAGPLLAQADAGFTEVFAAHPEQAALSDKFALDAIFAVEMAARQSAATGPQGAANTQRLQSLRQEVDTPGEWFVWLKTSAYVIALEENAIARNGRATPQQPIDERACRDQLIASLAKRRALALYPACSFGTAAAPPSSETSAATIPHDATPDLATKNEPSRRKLSRQPGAAEKTPLHRRSQPSKGQRRARRRHTRS